MDALTGLSLFLSINVAWQIQFQKAVNRNSIDKNSESVETSSTTCEDEFLNRMKKEILYIEKLVQRDEGGRGIGDILLPPGELYLAAKSLATSQQIAVLTGFPCNIENDPPTETDGPLGSLSIARTLLMLNKEVVILTDECNEEVLLASAAASGLYKFKNKFRLESFASSDGFDQNEMHRMEEICANVGFVVAIERCGPNFLGSYKTMRNKDISHLVAPLELMLMPIGIDDESFVTLTSNEMETDSIKLESCIMDVDRTNQVRSIGIGDGGNEIGMGKVYAKLINSKIDNIKEIACTVPTDHLIIASVSNWGAYALSAATAAVSLLEASTNQSDGAVIHLQSYLPEDETEIEICQRMVDAGARDGVTGRLECSVDGMPLETSLDVLRQIRKALSRLENCCSA